MKIVADQQIPYLSQAFSDIAEVLPCNGREITRSVVKNADALIVRSVTSVDATLLDGSQVKFVATATSGTDHIDVEYLSVANIGFAHTQGSNARAVAEYVLSSLFTLAMHTGARLQNQVIGVIGCGHVGSQVVTMLEAMNVQYMMNDPPLKCAVAKTDAAIYHDLEALLAADVVTLHVPLTETGRHKTRHLLGMDFFTKFNGSLVNTSRGAVIEALALKQTMQDKPQMKVALDVWHNEPAIDTELLSRITLGTPHIAGYSLEAKLKAAQMIYQAICKFFGIRKKWQTNALPSGSSVTIETNTSVEKAVKKAVLASYNVSHDHAALDRLPDLPQAQQANYFDRLRKHYPPRREFPATMVNLPTSALADTMNRLGFTVRHL